MRYFVLILLMFPMFCMAQNIPAVGKPVPVYNHPTRSLIPDNLIGNYKYIWYIIYPDHIINSIRQQGMNYPKEVGPLTESDCMGAVQDCSQEGLKVGYSKRLNPRYNPPKNGSVAHDDQQDGLQESDDSHEGGHPYDPLEDAVEKANQHKKKTVINDPNIVDLSDLKDPYAAKVDNLELKSPTQTNISKEKCQEALDYAANRIRILNQLLNNSDKLIAQQNKTIATVQKEVDDWEETLLNNKVDIASGIADVGIDHFANTDKLEKQIEELNEVKKSAQKTGKIATEEVSSGMLERAETEKATLKKASDEYGSYENAVKTGSLMDDNYNKGELNMNTIASNYLAVMNAVDLLNIPALKPIHYALLYAPLATDVAYRVGATPMSQQTKDELTRAKSDLISLELKIRQWRDELNEIKNCGNDCAHIRRLMNNAFH